MTDGYKIGTATEWDRQKIDAREASVENADHDPLLNRDNDTMARFPPQQPRRAFGYCSGLCLKCGTIHNPLIVDPRNGGQIAPPG